MEKAQKVRRILPSACIALFIVAMVAVSFLPPVRGAAVVPAAAEPHRESLDMEAMTALGDACAFAACNDFSVKTSGEIKAKAFGIPYTQKVIGGRSVKGGVYTEYAESKSAFVKSAFRKKSVAGGVEVSRGEYKNKKFVYGKPKFMASDAFEKSYGKPATGIVRYELDGTVKCAEKVKDGVYKYKLDAKRAAQYTRNEVKTLTKSDKHPVYESVSFTLWLDGSRPVKVCTSEVFRADICGGLRCTAKYTETFDFAKDG